MSVPQRICRHDKEPTSAARMPVAKTSTCLPWRLVGLLERTAEDPFTPGRVVDTVR